MRTLLLLAVVAGLIWLVLTLAHKAGIDIMPHGGLFQFPEVHWNKAQNLP